MESHPRWKGFGSGKAAAGMGSRSECGYEWEGVRGQEQVGLRGEGGFHQKAQDKTVNRGREGVAPGVRGPTA